MDQASSTMLMNNKEALRAKRMTLFENAVSKNTSRKLLLAVFAFNCLSLGAALLYFLSISKFYIEVRNSFKSKTESLALVANLNHRSLQFYSYIKKSFLYNQGIYSKDR